MKLWRSRERSENNEEFVQKGECLATFWQQATPGTTYWRCHVPARALPGQSIRVTVDDLAEKKGKIIYPRFKGETAVWQFLGDPARSRMALGLRDIYDVRTLMEVDDNYTTAPPKRILTTWADTIEDARGHFSQSGYSYEGNRIMATEVDGIIVSTDHLAEIYSRFNRNIYVCPNSVDPADWEYEREKHEPLRIVYYASQSRYFDTPLVTKALKWASRQPGVEVWTVGVDPKDWSFPHQKVGWTYDLVEARKHLFRFDIGIAPVAPNDFARGKSDVKALEYATAGVLPILSDVEPYAPWARVGWEWMAQTEADWQALIREAVRIGRDGVAEEAARAKAYVDECRLIEQNIDLWRKAVA